MIICTCRNISDEEEGWRDKIMKDDFKCGMCQMRILLEEEELEDIDSIEVSGNTLEEYLKSIEDEKK